MTDGLRHHIGGRSLSFFLRGATRYCLFISIVILSKTGAAQVNMRASVFDYPAPLPLSTWLLESRGTASGYLEPFSVRPLAVAVGESADNNTTSTIVGIEVAPLLVTQQVSLDEYLSGRLHRVYLRTRVSVAAGVDNGRLDRIACGLRWMLHDDADVGADSGFQRALITSGNSSAYVDSIRAFMASQLWNRSVFEFGAGVTYATPSDLLSIAKYGAQLSGAIAVGRGMRLGMSVDWILSRDSSNKFQSGYSVPLRLDRGNERERVFIGARWLGSANYSHTCFAECGAHISIVNGVWTQLEIGVPLTRGTLVEGALHLQWATTELH